METQDGEKAWVAMRDARYSAAMPLRSFGVLLVLALWWASAGNGLGQAPVDAPRPLPALRFTDGVVSLDGPWQFHQGDDPSWSLPSLDDSAWETVKVGQPWESQGHYGLRGFAWYRRYVVLSPDEHDANLALLLAGVRDAAEIYWNGRLVGRWGKVPPRPTWFNYQLPQVYSLGPSSSMSWLTDARSGVLAIRVWKAPVIFVSSPYDGGLTGIPRLGSATAVAALATAAESRWLRRSLFELAVALLSLVAGLVALLFWLRDRSRLVMLWVSLLMFTPAVELVLFDIPGVSTFALGYGLVAQLVLLTDICIWFLLIDLLELRDSPRLVRWARNLGFAGLALSMVDSVMVCLDWTRMFPRAFLWLDVVSTIPIELIELYTLVLVFAALRNLVVLNRQLDASRWLLAMAVVLSGLFTAVTDWTGLGKRWTHLDMAHKVSAPIATVWGSSVTPSAILNLLLLFSTLYAAWRYSVAQSQRQNALEQEFASARELQQMLVPESMPAVAGYGVTSAYHPAQEVGGDFFQIVPLDGDFGGEFAGSTLVILGDVSGKGLKAALAVSLIVGMVRALARFTASPGDLLTLLNERLAGSLRGGFATCLAVRLDADGCCTLANAGHLSPYRNGIELACDNGLPLGLASDVEYAETVLQLAPGEQITLLTDGVLEACNSTGELYGFDRTAAVSTQSAEAIATAAQTFGQDDDITVLTLTLTAAPHLTANLAGALDA